jgi:hypothetical protein
VCTNFIAAKALMQFGTNPLQRDGRGRTALHLANSRDMFQVILNKRIIFTNTATNLSAQSMFQNVITHIFTFEFVPAIFNRCMNTNGNIENDVNIKDKAGNTPLHSIVTSIRTWNASRCIDALETLIEQGANPCIRCKRGFLPIDHFRTVSPMLAEADIDKGERLLSCSKTKRHIRKEMWYFLSLTFAFITLYLSFLKFAAKRACCECGSTMSVDDSFSSSFGLFQLHYMYYAQFISVILLHCFLQINTVINTFVGTGNMHIRRYMYSENLFF